MTIYIKNMVCQRCINAVTSILRHNGMEVMDVRLGEAEITSQPSRQQEDQIRHALKAEGFEWLDQKSSRLVEQVKSLVIHEIHHGNGKKKSSTPYSVYLSRETGHDYSHLSKLFSSVEGITIEKYIIAQKIERAKELLIYGELSLAEISDALEYSSSQHLSTQFKQVIGMTPTEFRKSHDRHRHHLDHMTPKS